MLLSCKLLCNRMSALGYRRPYSTQRISDPLAPLNGLGDRNDGQPIDRVMWILNEVFDRDDTVDERKASSNSGQDGM